MLIDRTYFVGELNIPNTTNEAVGELLDLFIEKYEKELLTGVLGYSLYKEFMEGLQAVTIESKWTDLLTGKEYTPSGGSLKKWRGVIDSPDSIVVVNALGTTFITVGGGDDYDPVAGASTVEIPAELVGTDFTFNQRAVGELQPGVDYTISGSTLTLLIWTFSADDVYYYKSNTIVSANSSGIVRQSLIANYVYYWFMRNNHTQSTGMGEVSTKNENSAMSNPGLKMARAWNEMYQWICELHEFLDEHKDTYTNWENANPWQTLKSKRPINIFGI